MIYWTPFEKTEENTVIDIITHHHHHNYRKGKAACALRSSNVRSVVVIAKPLRAGWGLDPPHPFPALKLGSNQGPAGRAG